MLGKKHTMFENRLGRKLGPAVNNLGSKLIKNAVLTKKIIQEAPEKEKKSYLER